MDQAQKMAFSMEKDRAAFMQTTRAPYARIRKGFGLVEKTVHWID